jgi:hypothetical protein
MRRAKFRKLKLIVVPFAPDLEDAFSQQADFVQQKSGEIIDPVVGMVLLEFDGLTVSGVQVERAEVAAGRGSFNPPFLSLSSADGQTNFPVVNPFRNLLERRSSEHEIDGFGQE